MPDIPFLLAAIKYIDCIDWKSEFYAVASYFMVLDSDLSRPTLTESF